MNKRICIAIDGPSGSGKSTVASMVADKLSLIHLDTGSMYRAVGYVALCRDIDMSDLTAIGAMLESININVVFTEHNQQRIMVDNVDITDNIRTQEVSNAASRVAAIPAVRTKLVGLQRNIAADYPIIMDGRDIGTHVLTDADLKIYLTADSTERARRRLAELQAKGIDLDKTVDTVKDEIEMRDARDMNREISPLCVPKDAHIIDSTSMTVKQVCDKIVALAKEL